MDLKGRPVAILGEVKSGLSAARGLAEPGAEVFSLGKS